MNYSLATQWAIVAIALAAIFNLAERNHPGFFEAAVGFIAADGRVAGLVIIVVGILINLCFVPHPEYAAMAMVQARRVEDGEASQASSEVSAL